MPKPVVLVEFGEESSKQHLVTKKSADAVSEHGIVLLNFAQNQLEAKRRFDHVNNYFVLLELMLHT